MSQSGVVGVLKPIIRSVNNAKDIRSRLRLPLKTATADTTILSTAMKVINISGDSRQKRKAQIDCGASLHFGTDHVHVESDVDIHFRFRCYMAIGQREITGVITDLARLPSQTMTPVYRAGVSILRPGFN